MIIFLASCFIRSDVDVLEEPAGNERSPQVTESSATEVHSACSDPFVQDLVEGNREWSRQALSSDDFGTGSALFDEEWMFGTWMMAAVGLGQHAVLCPEQADANVAAMEHALRSMTSAGQAFDTREYGSDITQRLDEPTGSVALLGYGGLGLALYRSLSPEGHLVPLEEQYADALSRRLGGLVETYPGQIYPVDNAAGVAALALHDAVTGENHSQQIAGTLKAIEAARDPRTGLLNQRVGANGRALDAPRGSGTFLAAWFLHRADPELAQALYTSGRDQLLGRVMRMTAMREYPDGIDGNGDIDSGPLIFGYSVSASGFALGAATAFGDEATQTALLTTAQRTAPVVVATVPGLASADGSGATGSHLGDAILLAMLTAQGRP